MYFIIRDLGSKFEGLCYNFRTSVRFEVNIRFYYRRNVTENLVKSNLKKDQEDLKACLKMCLFFAFYICIIQLFLLVKKPPKKNKQQTNADGAGGRAAACLDSTQENK